MEKKKSAFPALRYLLPAVAFLVLAIFLLLGLSRNPNEIPSPLIDKPAPAYRLPRLAGAPPSVAAPAQTSPEAASAPTVATTTATATLTAPADTEHAEMPAKEQRQESSPTGQSSRDHTAPASQASASRVDAATLDSTQLRGKPYLLNVWASWCQPCLQEHPQLLALAQMQRIHLVGMNYKDQPADALAWLRRHGNPFDEIMADTRGRAGIDFGVYGVPETFLIDGEGRIRFKHTGVITPEVLQQRLLPAISALQGKP